MFKKYSFLFAGYPLEGSAGYYDIGKVYTSYEIYITDEVITVNDLKSILNLKQVEKL